MRPITATLIGVAMASVLVLTASADSPEDIAARVVQAQDEQSLLATWGHFPFILPMSGKFAVCITDGMPISDQMSGCLGFIKAEMSNTQLWSAILVWRSWRLHGFSTRRCVLH